VSGTAIILLLVAAVLHAGWNLVSKRREPTAAFFMVACAVSTIVFAPVVLLNWPIVAAMPTRVWWFLAGTGACVSVYFVALAASYRHGHISIAYPLARSSPVIVVTIVSVLLGRGDQVGAAAVAGIFIVVAGGFLLPMKHFRDLRVRNYLNRSCAFALLAAFGTAGYSIFDDEALRILRESAAVPGSTLAKTGVYIVLHVGFAAVLLAAFVASRGPSREALRATFRGSARHAALAGVAVVAGYFLVLLSLAHVRNVSYIAGFRQVSVPLGAILGVVILREPVHAPKFLGIALVFVGLVLIGLG
jgi:drug/metabolite transporter (DMT)-like permease